MRVTAIPSFSLVRFFNKHPYFACTEIRPRARTVEVQQSILMKGITDALATKFQSDGKKLTSLKGREDSMEKT